MKRNRSDTAAAFIWHKGKVFKLSENFSSHEFECPCNWSDCLSVTLTNNTLISVQETREAFKKPVIVSSGNRCSRRNEIVGGVENSSHVWGDGVDLTCEDLNDLDLLEEVMKDKFLYTKRYDTHVHGDNRLHVL